MNRIIGVAIVLLVVWAAGTWMEWPGWVHGLLTAGMFLLIYGIVRGRGDRKS